MIYVMRLDGSQFVVNADLIETVEHTADTVITLLDGKKLVVKTRVEEIVDRVVGYRQMIARGPMRQFDSPSLGSPAAAVHHNNQNNEPTPFRLGPRPLIDATSVGDRGPKPSSVGGSSTGELPGEAR